MATINLLGRIERPIVGVTGVIAIKVITYLGAGEVLTSAETTFFTDEEGNYDFQLAYGSHSIYVMYTDTFEPIGNSVVNESVPTPVTFSELLKYSTPINPDTVNQIYSDLEGCYDKMLTAIDTVSVSLGNQVVDGNSSLCNSMTAYYNERLSACGAKQEDFVNTGLATVLNQARTYSDDVGNTIAGQYELVCSELSSYKSSIDTCTDSLGTSIALMESTLLAGDAQILEQARTYTSNTTDLVESSLTQLVSACNATVSVSYEALSCTVENNYSQTMEYVNTTLEAMENQYQEFTSGNFIDVATYEADLASIRAQIDKSITTWFYAPAPSMTSLPVSDWLTSEYEDHLGDLYYSSVSGMSYRFSNQAGVYSWEEVNDTATTAALAVANKAQDTADSKRRVFYATPVVPYDRGDLWDTGSGLKRATASRTTSYSAADWMYVTDGAGSANAAKLAAQEYALSQVSQATTATKAYADGIVDAVEIAALAQATALVDATYEGVLTSLEFSHNKNYVPIKYTDATYKNQPPIFFSGADKTQSGYVQTTPDGNQLGINSLKIVSVNTQVGIYATAYFGTTLNEYSMSIPSKQQFVLSAWIWLDAPNTVKFQIRTDGEGKLGSKHIAAPAGWSRVSVVISTYNIYGTGGLFGVGIANAGTMYVTKCQMELSSGTVNNEPSPYKSGATAIDVLDQTALNAAVAASEVATNAYADGIVTAEEQRAIADATTKANAARDAAISAASTDATTKANAAKAAAQAYTLEKSNLTTTQYKAYVDGIITPAELAALEESAASANQAAEDSLAFAKALKVGGVNLLNGTLDGTVNTYKATRTTDTYLDFSIARNTTPASGYQDVVALKTDFLVGTTYTISFYAKSSDATCRFRSYLYSPYTTLTALSSTGFTGTSTDGGVYATATNKWERHWITWTQPTDKVVKHIVIGRLTAGSSTGSLEICGIKFEEGNVATAWTSSPQDDENNYNAYALAKANLATTTSNSYADGIITAEEQRAIADATTKANAAYTKATKYTDDNSTTKNYVDGIKNTLVTSINGLTGTLEVYTDNIDDLTKDVTLQQSAYSIVTSAGNATASISLLASSFSNTAVANAEILLKADKVSIWNGDSSTKVQPFYVSNNKVMIKTAVIETAIIATLNAQKIKADTVKANITIESPKIIGGELNVGAGGIYNGHRFHVSTQGYLYAQTAHITGYVNATSGNFAGTFKAGVVDTATIAGGAVTRVNSGSSNGVNIPAGGVVPSLFMYANVPAGFVGNCLISVSYSANGGGDTNVGIQIYNQSTGVLHRDSFISLKRDFTSSGAYIYMMRDVGAGQTIQINLTNNWKAGTAIGARLEASCLTTLR